MSATTDIVRLRVRDLMTPAGARAAPGQPLSQAVETMITTATPCVVADGNGAPAGILTESDVARRVTWRLAPTDPVSRAASAPVVTVRTDDTLFQALCVMRRHRQRRLPVVDEGGRLAGLLEMHDALWAVAGPATRMMDLLSADDSIEGLAAVKAAQADLAAALLAEDVPGPEVQRLISEINVDLHRRGLAQAVSAMTKDGWGPPPVGFSLIVMGSHGRAENFLAPDQDHAMVLAEYPDSEHDRVNAYFVPLAERFVDHLTRIGFSLCKGNVMCTNPVWRKRASEWREQVLMWVGRHLDQHLLMSDILLDFRHAAGDERLSAGLRDVLQQAIRSRPRFIKELLAIEADHRVALGWFGGLSKEHDDEDRPGFVNLKMRGSLPLVEGVRLLCLNRGISLSGSTLERLDRLREGGALSPDTHDYVAHGYALVSRLLFNSQIECARAGQEPNDYLEERKLTRRERDQLVACLREIDTLRTSIKQELADSAL